MTEHATILLVDDHPLFREGLKTIISRNPGYTVTGEAGSSREALKITKKLKPDLVLLDISLPDQNGLELIGDMQHASPQTQIIIISMHSKINYIVRAFQAGARGYIVKESATERLEQGISTVLKGKYFMDTAISQQVVEKLAELEGKMMKTTDTGYGNLTPREQEIMVLVAVGFSTNETAERLFISRKTVENHRASIMRKLNIHSSVELVRYAARIGIIDVNIWKE